jgi:hypothetical protein
MPLSGEHKQKLAEGRARAALARKQAADARALPPGADRNELRAINKDQLEEQIEERANEAEIEAIDPAKLERKDNEIMRHVRRRDRNGSGVPVENMEAGYRYAWLTNATAHGTTAQPSIRQQLADAKGVGYVPVQGKDAAGKKFESGDGVSGTTLRGVGDVFLHKIREEDYQETLREDEEKNRRQGIIEDRAVVYARDRLGMNVMHNIADASDNFVSQRERSLGSEALKPVSQATTHFTEGDLRRGSMKGPDGQTLKPGFERRSS